MDIKRKAKELEFKLAAIYIAFKRKDTPVIAKVFAGLAIVYAFSPIDLIPDFIPVLGYLDDIIIVPALAAAAIRFIPKYIMEECRLEAETVWKEGKPKRWLYALPVIIIWAALLLIIIFSIF